MNIVDMLKEFNTNDGYFEILSSYTPKFCITLSFIPFNNYTVANKFGTTLSFRIYENDLTLTEYYLIDVNNNVIEKNYTTLLGKFDISKIKNIVYIYLNVGKGYNHKNKFIKDLIYTDIKSARKK